MPALTPAEEITHSEPIINLSDVQARLAVLRPFHVEDTRLYPQPSDAIVASYSTREEAEAYLTTQDEDVRPYLEVIEDDDESNEQAALQQLETELAGLGGHASAISDGYLLEFVQDEAEDIYGDLGDLQRYVDWGRYAADRADRTVDYRGGTFHLIP
jgi:hypothetical protein